MVKGLAELGCRVDLLTLPGRYEISLPAGVQHRPLQVYADNFLARALAFRHRVARELVALRPDIIHFRGIFEGRAAVDYAQRFGATTIFEVNGLPSIELAYHYPEVGDSVSMLGKLRDEEQQLIASVNAVFTQSQTTLRFVESRGLPESTQRFVIANGANMPVHAPVNARAESQDATILYCGTLAPWQGIGELLMAARRWQTTTNARLILAGPVRQRWQKTIERVMARLKIADHVELTGPLSKAELAQRIDQADICIAPLRKDARNVTQGCSPIKLFEYMAAARPTIVTDLPCTREIVGPDRSVLVSSPRPKALAHAVTQLLSDPITRQELGHAAQAWVRSHATWQHRRAELQTSYRSVWSTFG